jgi:formate C-acetyltransferase
MVQAYTGNIAKSSRVERLVDQLLQAMPEIEADRAVLLTDSYAKTQGQPVITRRSKAFKHVLDNIQITIRPEELIVGSSTKAPRSCQVFPEFSVDWLEKEFDTISARSADPFVISDNTKQALKDVCKYWKGKTTSELAFSYMLPEARRAIDHNIFTPGNYLYNGVGHVSVDYGKVLKIGYEGIIAESETTLSLLKPGDSGYARQSRFLQAVIESCRAVCDYAKRYSTLALSMSKTETDSGRKQELLLIAQNCERVPCKGASSFYEACQSFWFIQMLIQMESNGHSVSPGRFDQYMYPFYKTDIESGKITREFAQELIDCIWVKLNDVSKVRDAASAEGFAGYGLFQNLVVGGQTGEGIDATNDLSYMCVEASMHVMMPQPSLSIRVWNGTPHELMVKAAELTRTGIGLPAYYNDEVIIPALAGRGLTLRDAREYNLIGCVEPQKAGKTDGWHDAAFFNMCRPLELVFSNGVDAGAQIGVKTGDVTKFSSFEELYDAYKTQTNHMIELMINAINAIDTAHAERCPLPFLSSMIEDCIGRGKAVQEGGAVYNFSGPQGFGIANMTDSLLALKALVFDQMKYTLADFKSALENNFGRKIMGDKARQITAAVAVKLAQQGKTPDEKEIAAIYQTVCGNEAPSEKKSRWDEMLQDIESLPKYGNDILEVDEFARDVAYTYTKKIETYKNPRGGQFHAGLYPVSANVPLGAQTGATPDGRLAGAPIADGVSPAAGRDVSGPTAACNSVSRLDHCIASNGTLFNMKFHPSALAGKSGLESFVYLIRGFFEQKGSHVQFNVVSRETLLDAQKHPDKYRSLVVRVAGYSALFTNLSRSLQDDIINRTEQTVS